MRPCACRQSGFQVERGKERGADAAVREKKDDKNQPCLQTVETHACLDVA